MSPSTASRSGSRSTVPRLAVLAWLVSCAAAEAAGPNLLVNPGFDHDTAGWGGNWGDPTAPAPTFDPMHDVEGSPASGSALVLAPVNGGPLICQCVNISAGNQVMYRYGGWVMLPPTDPSAGLYFTLDTYDQPDCTGTLTPDLNGSATLVGGGYGWSEIEGVNSVSAEKSLRFCGVSGVRGSAEPVSFDDLFVRVGSPGDCAYPGLFGRLCLSQNRFAVEATYTTAGVSGPAQVVQPSPSWGYLWFFVSDSVEVTLKVIDACALNGHYWVFASGLTNVGVAITVTDTQSGKQQTYTNKLGRPFPNIQDTQAFATCP